MHVRHGDYVDGISLAWIQPDGTFVEGPHHGGGGGTEDSFTLEPGETIQVIRGASGDLVDSLSFQTSLGRTYGPYGGRGGNPFEVNFAREPNPIDRSPGAAVIHPLTGIFGRSGDLLDAIGFWTDLDFVTG